MVCSELVSSTFVSSSGAAPPAAGAHAVAVAPVFWNANVPSREKSIDPTGRASPVTRGSNVVAHASPSRSACPASIDPGITSIPEGSVFSPLGVQLMRAARIETSTREPPRG